MTKAELIYADILFQNRPNNPKTRKKHPPMSLEERAKIFAPFRPLHGMNEALNDEDHKRLLTLAEHEGNFFL